MSIQTLSRIGFIAGLFTWFWLAAHLPFAWWTIPALVTHAMVVAWMHRCGRLT